MNEAGEERPTSQPPDSLDRTDVAGFLAFRTRAALERDALVFRQALEAAAFDVLEVREQIATAVVRGDEAKTLGIVEPFNYASLSTHVLLPLKTLKKIGPMPG